MLHFKEYLTELKLGTIQSYQAKRGNRDSRIKTAVAAIDHKFARKPGLSKHEIHTKGLERARARVDKERKKQTEMNPQRKYPESPAKTGFRSGAMDDTYGT